MHNDARLPVDGLTLFAVVQPAEVQRFQMIAVRLRWPPLHPDEPDNGGLAVVATIGVRHEGLKKLCCCDFNVLEDSLALPLQQRREGLRILCLARQGNLYEALRKQAFGLFFSMGNVR